MGREISLFANYRQEENTLTNYCGLLMKLLYENSPNQFEEFLSTIISPENSVVIGPSFNQQKKEKNSIPDLAVSQNSFTIFFETKLTNWHYEEQINNHIKGFDNSGDKILFLLSNFDSDPTEQFKDVINAAEADGIIIKPISFEEFIGSLEEVCNTEYLENLLDEFKIYLDRNEHLPKWKYMLDVVNCGESLKEVLSESVYMCPDTGGAYSHRRAKYFGPYKNKAVKSIFEIKAIISIEPNIDEPKVKWKNVVENDDALISQAIKKFKESKKRVEANKAMAYQVFLLHKKIETNFVKETSGGMYQSKKYFWDIASDCKNSEELAKKLQDKEWGEF